MTYQITRPVQGDAPERLAAWRAARGLTQAAAAKAIGCGSQSTYSEIERGLLWPAKEIRDAARSKAGIPLAAWGERPPRRRSSAPSTTAPTPVDAAHVAGVLGRPPEACGADLVALAAAGRVVRDGALFSASAGEVGKVIVEGAGLLLAAS